MTNNNRPLVPAYNLFAGALLAFGMGPGSLTEVVGQPFGAAPSPVDSKSEAASEPATNLTIAIEDVGKYLKDESAPKRPGTLKFENVCLTNRQGQTYVTGEFYRSMAGFKLGYSLAAKVLNQEASKGTLHPHDLFDIKIEYTDILKESRGLRTTDVGMLVSQLYEPSNKAQCVDVVVPGGEIISFSAPMLKLIMMGSAARQPLHRKITDKRIQNEVVLILGAIGDESTVEALINAYPEIDIRRLPSDGEAYYTARFNIACMTHALTYLTGQPIGRSRAGADYDLSNRRRWIEWWEQAKRGFRVQATKPNATWVPLYPDLSQDWAAKCRRMFEEGK